VELIVLLKHEKKGNIVSSERDKVFGTRKNWRQEGRVGVDAESTRAWRWVGKDKEMGGTLTY